MFETNAKLRGCDEKVTYEPWMIEELIKCKNDLLYFIKKYMYIVTIDDGKQLINLWGFQKKILKVFVEPPNGKRHVCLLSSRQVGKSTMTRAYLLHYMLFNTDKTAAILGNKELTSRKLLKEFKDAYMLLPKWLQSGVKTWNAGTVELENNMRLISRSTSSSAIRTETISLLILDEFAFVPDNIASDFMASVLPTISSGKTSKVIVVSTPNGLNHFYNIWQNSIRDNTSYYPIKINWDEVPGRDAAWKEEMIKTLTGGIVQWNQEFGCKFLGSNNNLIDPDILERLFPQEPKLLKWNGIFQIYEEPIKEKLYILGIDSGKGTGRDYSVIQVLRIDSEFEIEQVAIYRNNMIDTHSFSEVCISISEYYNKAQMMIENNDVGSAVCDTIWHEFEYDNICNCDKKGLGINSTKTTKIKACMLLKRYIESNWLKINNRETVVELSHYVELRPNIFNAESQGNDDTVSSLYWALYYIETPFFEGKDISIKHLEEKYKLEKDYEDEMPVMIFDEGGTKSIYDDPQIVDKSFDIN